jgi:hypothetical protein
LWNAIDLHSGLQKTFSDQLTFQLGFNDKFPCRIVPADAQYIWLAADLAIFHILLAVPA